MKRILLSTTALTMTAGIAAAEVSITGDFRLGFNDTNSNHADNAGGAIVAPVAAQGAYNSTDAAGNKIIVAAVAANAGTPTTYIAATTSDKKLGVYNDAGIAIAMSSTLDNGMSAGITVDLDGSDFAAQAKDKYTLSVSNDSTSVTFGTTEYSAITNWTSAGDMGTDTWANQNADNLNVLRAETTVGGLKVSVSQNVAAGTAVSSTDPVSITVGGALGGASYVIASEGKKMGIAATTAVGGATVTTAYSTAPSIVTSLPITDVNKTTSAHATSMNTSTGVKISYPAGAVVTTASYVMESNGTGQTAGTLLKDSWNIAAVWTSGDTSVTFKTDEASAYSIEGSTKLGAATLSAGLADSMDDMYVSVNNPLGGGASIMASYAVDAGTDAGDEVGGPDLQEGLTIELKFAF
jgi:hypothetical protein